MTCTAELVDDAIHLEYEPRYRMRIRELPGVTFSKDGGTKLRLSWGACQALRGVFGDKLVVGPALKQWARYEAATRIRVCMELRTQLEAPGDARLWPLQRVGVEFITTAGRALLADDCGAGKTIQVATALREFGPGALPALVVAPNSVKRQWVRELGVWAPELSTALVEGSVTQRRKTIADCADVTIINWDVLAKHSRIAPNGRSAMSAADKTPKELNEIPYRTIVFDEAHRLCNSNNIWARAARWLARDVEYAWALTGTPMESSPDELWGIMSVIAPDDWSSKSAFIDRYCHQAYAPWGGVNVDGLLAANEPEFRRIFEPRYIRRTLREIAPQVPEPLMVTREIELPAKLRKAYDQMVDEQIAELESGTLIAWDPLTQGTRLVQLASATMSMDGDRWRLKDPSPKVDALVELLDEMGEKPLVVFAQSRQLIEIAAKRLTKLKIPHALIVGGMSTIQRTDSEASFESGAARVLLLTLGAGAEGLNLTTADTLVFLQRSWSRKQNLQASRRIVRPGAEKHDRLLIIDIVARDTIEETIQQRYRDKEESMELVFRDKDRIAEMLRGAT